MTSVLCPLVLEVTFQFWTALFLYTSNSNSMGKAVTRCVGHCSSILVLIWLFLFIVGVWRKVYKTVKSKYFHFPSFSLSATDNKTGASLFCVRRWKKKTQRQKQVLSSSCLSYLWPRQKLSSPWFLSALRCATVFESFTAIPEHAGGRDSFVYLLGILGAWLLRRR